MKKFSIALASMAILWAIFSPPLISVLEAAEGIHPFTRSLREMARNLRSELPKDSASNTVLVSLPADRVSYMASMLDLTLDAFQKVSSLHTFDTVISSVVICILSIYILATCGEMQKPRPNPQAQEPLAVERSTKIPERNNPVPDPESAKMNPLAKLPPPHK